jgi:hypothetical protein
MTLDTPCTAFEGSRCIANGAFEFVALAAKHAVDAAAQQTQPLPVLVFMDATSEVIELDWRGSEDTFTAHLCALAQKSSDGAEGVADAPAQPAASRGPGRPKLGVVAREVTLLPRHWEWLASQPGGASVALRKLVDAARRATQVQDHARQAIDVAYKFMSIMTGHLPGFEEASRALFAGDLVRMNAHMAAWPADIQQHLKRLLNPVLGE